MTDNASKTATPGKKKLIATVGITAAGLLVALTGKWEGLRTDPYQDIAGVWTVCRGDTSAVMRHYTTAECDDMFDSALSEHAEPVLRRNPELKGHPYQLAAAVSLAYNIGPAAYDRSTAAKLFSAGRWREACDSFLAWKYAGGRVSQGLLNRRREERNMCLKGLA